MKLTELILLLHTIMLEKGNLNVYVNSGCGCCEEAYDPNPALSEGGEYRNPYPGVYLN